MTINRPHIPQLATPTGYTHVTIATGTRIIYCAGQTALDASGAIVGEQDLAAQAQQAFKNLAIALQAASATMTDIVKMTMYIVELNDNSLSQISKGAFYATKDVGQQLPLTASTVVGVQRLANAQALFEVEAVAVLS